MYNVNSDEVISVYDCDFNDWLNHMTDFLNNSD